MKLKLSKDYFDVKAGSVIDVKEVDAVALISDGHKIYTEDMEKADKALVINKFKEDIKMSDNEVVEVKKEMTAPNIIVKKEVKNSFVDGIKDLASGKIKQIELKAPTGQDETDAADGLNLVYQGMDNLHGALLLNSVIWPKCEKLPIGDGQYGRFIPYRNETTLNTTSAPRTYNPGEGVAKTPTKMAFGKVDLKLGTNTCLVYLTEEILQDVSYIEQYVTNAMKGKLSWDVDYNILNGTYSAAVQGMTGVFGATAFYTEPIAHAATYTGTIINGIISGVDPRLRQGSEWFMSNSMHATLIGQLGVGTTVSTQPIFSNNGMTLAGYPVNVMTQMAAFGSAGDILFGNFGAGYSVAEKGSIILAKSTDYAFTTDEVVLRATWRTLGAPTFAKYTPMDNRVVAAFASTSGT